jgi:geranylgeranyl pyrophosphate synthase
MRSNKQVTDTTTKALVAQGVAWFGEQITAEAADDHLYVQEAARGYLAILQAGGKRLRGQLAVLGYRLHAGADDELIAHAAGAIEGLHAHLLVIDDVADHAPTRRGVRTAHLQLQDFLREQGASQESALLANDMAISFSLVVQQRAQIVFGELTTTPTRRLRVLRVLNEHLARTGRGQVLDMASSTGMALSQADIAGIAQRKTAYYSFQMPLEIGAILAGASRSSLWLLGDFSKHAGMAFQQADDLMGVFGDEAKMGKSAKSDIVEGKQTLLMHDALEEANAAERRVLRSALGNAHLSDADFARCQEIIATTGAQKRTQQLAEHEARLALGALEFAPSDWPAGVLDELRTITGSIVGRQN